MPQGSSAVRPINCLYLLPFSPSLLLTTAVRNILCSDAHFASHVPGAFSNTRRLSNAPPLPLLSESNQTNVSGGSSGIPQNELQSPVHPAVVSQPVKTDRRTDTAKLTAILGRIFVANARKIGFGFGVY